MILGEPQVSQRKSAYDRVSNIKHSPHKAGSSTEWAHSDIWPVTIKKGRQSYIAGRVLTFVNSMQRHKATKGPNRYFACPFKKTGSNTEGS